MRTWFQKRFMSPSPAPDAALPEGWFAPQPAETLLATVSRQSHLYTLRQLTPLTDRVYEDWIVTLIQRFARLVQLFPASQQHHHAHPGGLLDHSLEVACHAVRLRQGRLLPVEASAEEQARQADAWSVAILCAALLHDTGKVAADIHIHQQDGTVWCPWQPPLAQPYTWHHRTDRRDYHLHPSAGALLVMPLFPPSLMSWLGGYPELFAALIYSLTGHPERAGLMAELIQEADKASVAKSLGGDIKTALAQKPGHLSQQLLTALRALVLGEYRLNNPDCGSDGWLTRDALWLVSKPTADRLRAWLLQHGISGVPENNNRLFDELMAHQMIIANNGKGIWRCRICAETGWSPGESLTLLRIAPTVIWQQTTLPPPVFAGSVIPVTEQQAFTEAVPVPEFTLPDLPVIPAVSHAVTGSPVPFMAWLETHLTVAGAVNNPRAYVHLVEDNLFLVTPGIFRRYMQEISGTTGDEWKLAQKAFQAQAILRRRSEDSYIWTCEVKSPGKTRNLKGFLMPEPQRLFHGNVPVNNPWLRLISE